MVRVADALDMAQGRTRIPIEAGHEGIHSISAAAIDEVRISAGEEHPVRIEIQLNNSAGIFQVDDLLATKIRGTPLEGKVEVLAEIEGETEKRLLSGFRLPSDDRPSAAPRQEAGSAVCSAHERPMTPPGATRGARCRSGGAPCGDPGAPGSATARSRG